MKRIYLGTLLGLLVWISITLGQSGAAPNVDYDVTWWTIDGGGGTSTGGDYALSGTIGQPDSGVWAGGRYTLNGGFWLGARTSYLFYLPLAVKES